MALQLVTDDERRARLARRHRLAPEARADDLLDATRSIICLHATDPATIALSAWARVKGFEVGDLERAMYEDRSLVKHMAMRRTLFVFPREMLGAAQAGASARVHESERKRVSKDVVESGVADDADAWYAEASGAVLARLAGGDERSSVELKDELAILQSKVWQGSGKWAQEAAVGPRLLTAMQAAGQVVRSTNQGAWYTSRPRWSSMEAWLGEPLDVPSADDGTRALVEAWQRAFGPGTTADIKWWLGGTIAATKRAAAELDAVEVQLESGSVGWLLPDDLEPEPAVDPWGALLPSLDPAPMGWQERGWYLGDHKALVYDSVGNVGPTIWWDGRIVGGWRQLDDGAVELQWLDDVGADARAVIEAQAAALTDWLGGVRVMMRFPSPLSRQRAGD